MNVWKDVLVHKNSLHTDARLPGVAKSRVGRALRCPVQIAMVAVNDKRRIATQFQQNPLAPGVRLQFPAHFGRPGETHQLDAVFLFGEPRSVGIRQRHHRECLFRPAGLQNHFTQRQRGKRRLRRWLDQDRAARGNRRRSLVRHQVQREIERCNRQHRTNRKTLHQPPAILVALSQIERNRLAAKPRRFFGRRLERQHRAVHLGTREPDRLARLRNDELGEAILLLDQSPGDIFEDLASLPARQRTRATHAGHRMVHGFARIGACSPALPCRSGPGPTVSALQSPHPRSTPCRREENRFAFLDAFS